MSKHVKSEERTYIDGIICPAPRQLESGAWTLELTIKRPLPGGYEEALASASNTFETREEAVRHCYIFGAQLID